MRGPLSLRWAVVLAVLLCGGCHQGDWWVPQPYHQSQIERLHQSQLAAQQQREQATLQAGNLDHKNDELSSLVAQSNQQIEVLKADLTAVRGRLKETATELETARRDKLAAEQRTEAVLAATRSRGGALITANNSLTDRLADVRIPGVDIRRDGDVIRIRLPDEQLFSGDTAQFLGGAGGLLDRVAGELAHAYPDQIIGVEGHLGRDPGARNSPGMHALSTSQATAVFQYLVDRSQLRSEQLFVVGHGANHPIYSNADVAGRRGNSRIELVVYPERAGRR